MKFANFISNQYEESFNEFGFIHIPSFLSNSELTVLKNLFEESYNYQGEEHGMWNSLYNVSQDQSAKISATILEVLKEKLASTFENIKTPVATFMVKNPNLNGITKLHRDYSSQDESQFQYRNVWIPLINITPENGTLYALKHSHQFFDYPLPMFTKWSYSKYEDLLFKHCDFINAKAGDLVVYADRTLHGSFINQTQEPRPVVHFGLLHPEAELCYYYLDESSNEVTVYNVPFSFYMEKKFGNQNNKFPIVKKFSYSPPIYNQQQILSFLKNR